MGKKNRGKANKKSAAYKPNTGLARPALDASMKKMSEEPSKRAKKQAKVVIEGGEDSEEIDRRSKVKVTDDMFLAAKLMKNGVSHVKDLDYSVINRNKSLKQAPGNCEVTIIDIFTGEVKMAKVVKPLNKDACRFDFKSESDFSPDADSIQVAKKAWDWLLNPIGFDKFVKDIKDRKILII